MKMLGWLSKKFHRGSAEYQRVATAQKIPGVIYCEEISEKLNTLSTLQDMTENDYTETSIFTHKLLTIGTFGYSTPLPHHDLENIDDYIRGSEDEHLEEKPAEIVPSTTQNLNTAIVTVIHKPFNEELDMPITKQIDITEEIIISQEPLLKESKEGINEKRTTLADLLIAESASANAAKVSDAFVIQKCKSENVKMIKKKSEVLVLTRSARKKLHKMIDKMTKKKVHPVMAQYDQEQNTKNRADG